MNKLNKERTHNTGFASGGLMFKLGGCASNEF